MQFSIVRTATTAFALVGALALAAPVSAQGQCARETLQDVADRYVKAQHDGSVFALPVGEWVDYRENYGLVSSATGVISQPSDFAWHVALVDTGNCRVLVEGVILKPKPYVVATRLAWSFNGLGQIGSVVTQAGDPQFDAQQSFDSASREDWGTIAPDRRNTREELIAAARAHLATLAGSGPVLTEPEFTVDETKGAVGVRGLLGGPEGPAVSHVFRIEGGSVRFAHSMSAKQS